MRCTKTCHSRANTNVSLVDQVLAVRRRRGIHEAFAQTLAGATCRGLHESASMLFSGQTSDPEELMPRHIPTENDLSHQLLRVLDWVHLTGWPTRSQDTAMAAEVFDAWRLATDDTCRHGKPHDRLVLLESLHSVFSTVHDADATEHLCVLFAITLEAHMRSATHDRGGTDA
jgi:hypothetical protein